MSTFNLITTSQQLTLPTHLPCVHVKLPYLTAISSLPNKQIPLEVVRLYGQLPAANLYIASFALVSIALPP
jgi:hypothetical protein